MQLRLRGIDLPGWTSETGAAANRVWVEFLRREQRMEKARVEYEAMASFALAGSPQGDPEKRFDVLSASKTALYAHIDQSVHRTGYKRALLERRAKVLETQQEEMRRLDWIGSGEFSLSDWVAGK
jgi:hypothetical protein